MTVRPEAPRTATRSPTENDPKSDVDQCVVGDSAVTGVLSLYGVSRVGGLRLYSEAEGESSPASQSATTSFRSDGI